MINAAHILGLSTLFGSVVALDLRLLGAFRSIPVSPLVRLLPRIAGAGLGLAIVTGANSGWRRPTISAIATAM
jgi:hypothetical protein